MTDLTFRERIMRHLQSRFEGQVAGTGDATITWDTVTRKPLNKLEQHMTYGIGLYDTSEKVKQEIGHDLRFLNVVLEFHCRVSEAETGDVGSILNAALGEVQRVALSDIHCVEVDPDTSATYQLALDVNEKGSEIDVGGEKPTSVAGVLIIEVKYRTKSNNPFKR